MTSRMVARNNSTARRSFIKRKNMAKKNLPKTLFVKKVIDGDTEYFESSEKKETLWESMTDWVDIGEYRFVKTTKIKGCVIEKK